MLNIFSSFKKIFSSALLEISPELNTEELLRFTVEPTREKSHGDLACNAAMIFSKKLGMNPRELAQKIIEKIKNDDVAKLEIAGPGFINIFLKPQILHRVITDLVERDFTFPQLGRNKNGQGEKINLEYASPNPTGPIHVGHTRGAIYGDVLATLLQKTGYDVLKEYYINDAGAQILTLVKSAYLRYLQACGEKIEISDGLYPGEYLIPIGQALKEKFGDSLLNHPPLEGGSRSEATRGEVNPLDPTSKSQATSISTQGEDGPEIIRDFVVAKMVELIKHDLLALGIKHDSYFSEKKELHDTGKIDAAIKILRDKGLIYEGKLEAPKTEKGVGALPEGYDEKDQTLFAATKFGDDQDRVVKKADGTPTYLAGDIAYSLSKWQRGAKKFIMPLGFDHAGYIKRLSAVVSAITNDQAQVKVILCQMVKFVKNGEPLKMSKRAGNFITAREVIDEVGADVLRFIMLTRKNDAPFDFDLTKVIEQSKDNPIFYVQYAHARCCSVLRQAVTVGSWKSVVGSKLVDEAEIELMKKIVNFPRVIEMSVEHFEPHRIAFYLQELAGEFHALWNKGTENPELRFIINDHPELTAARLALVTATKKIIAAGLSIFNIQPTKEMR
ncbi:MAG: arginine--tRNA ligase [Alphaproteobacteria bacterium]|nr:arginine--tRNA ligase [Alphaproteobacteria bacterium]